MDEALDGRSKRATTGEAPETKRARPDVIVIDSSDDDDDAAFAHDPDGDLALARRLQAEDDARRRLPIDDEDLALARRLQAEEDGARPTDDASAAFARRLQAEEDARARQAGSRGGGGGGRREYAPRPSLNGFALDADPRGRVRHLTGSDTNGLFAVIREALITPRDASALAARAAAAGFGPARTGPGVERRKSLRCLIDDGAVASALFERLRPLLPATLPMSRGNVYKAAPGTWRLVGLNERLRFLRYDPGDYFKPHHDGVYCREAGDEQSFLTLLLYLNDGYRGGHTTLYNGAGAKTPVAPAIGLCLVHDHKVRNESPTLREGVKLVIRTDVMYSLRD